MRPTPRSRAVADRIVALFGPGPVPVAAVVAAGVAPVSLRSAVRAGTVVRARRGLVVPVVADAPDDDVRERLAIELCRVGRAAFASHEWAAHLLGLPSPAPLPEHVTLTAPGVPDRCDSTVRVRGSGVPDWQRAVVEGIPCTDVARTAVDLARYRPLGDALIPIDAAARLLIDLGRPGPLPLRRAVHDHAAREAARTALARVVDSMRGWPGIVAARAAVAELEPAAESPFESRSRAWILASHLPAPQCGVAVRGASGDRYWVDFWFAAHGVAGEADGLAKYGDGDQRRMRAERVRQSDLEAAGIRVVRWTTGEARDVVIRRIDTVLRASGRLPDRRHSRN